MGKTFRKSETVKCRGCKCRVSPESIVENGLCEGCWGDEQDLNASHDPAGGDDDYESDRNLWE